MSFVQRHIFSVQSVFVLQSLLETMYFTLLYELYYLLKPMFEKVYLILHFYCKLERYIEYISYKGMPYSLSSLWAFGILTTLVVEPFQIETGLGILEKL